MFLLDTNVVSELRRRKRADPNVLAWADGTEPARLFLSAVTILELQVGALLLARRDPARAGVLQRWIAGGIRQSFAGRILPLDYLVALRCAPLHVPNTRPERDAMIAATALEHRFTVVTRNVRDFASMDVPLLNPWEC
jgi:predicted nucleic acid-binding protein